MATETESVTGAESSRLVASLMAIFDLDRGYSASFIPPWLGPRGEGTIFCGGKPVEIFEAHGLTLADTEKAAEVCEGLKVVKPRKTQSGPLRKLSPLRSKSSKRGI